MKKVFVLFVTVIFFVSMIGLQSCRKCSTCHYSYTDAFGTPYTYTYAQSCGKKKVIDDYEQACKDAAASAGGSCSCTNK